MTIDEIKDLREQYPAYISENQMYKICHISKRTCRYLLESGLVPCIDNHKKSHRFKVRIDDVMDYLYKRESGIELKRPPAGYYAKKRNAEKSQWIIRKELLSEEGQEVVRRYYEEKMEGWPDVMRIWWVSRLLGCSVTTVSKLCQGRKVKAFFIEGAYRIPKECLIDYLVSKEYRCRRKNTPEQLKHEEKLEELLRNQQKENEGCSGQQALLPSEESFSEASSPAVVSDHLIRGPITRRRSRS